MSTTLYEAQYILALMATKAMASDEDKLEQFACIFHSFYRETITDSGYGFDTHVTVLYGFAIVLNRAAQPGSIWAHAPSFCLH